MSRLDTCLDWIIRAEGGGVLVHDPNDRGGLTKYGISQKAYPQLDIPSLTEADARAIYERDYWKPCQCEALPMPLDLILLDGAVLMGAHAVIGQLQRALGVVDDGVIGPKTLAAAKSRGVAALPHLFTERVLYLAATKTWKHHGRGWMVRTFRLAKEAF